MSRYVPVSLLLILVPESSDVNVRYFRFSQLFGRTVKANIAIDNGRATEFIRRRNYTDKSKCYECGVSASSPSPPPYNVFMVDMSNSALIKSFVSCILYRTQGISAMLALKTFWEKENLRRRKKRKKRKGISNHSTCMYIYYQLIHFTTRLFMQGSFFFPTVKRKQRAKKRERIQNWTAWAKPLLFR